jgi:RNA polymerase sigma factor (sigma-70 family)
MGRVHEAAGEAERLAVVAIARTGDETAFGRLVERHRRELQLHCYRMVGSLEESEDLVQETFLRAWRRRESFEGRASFRAWLYRIATNACLDALAQRPRRMLPFDVVPAARLEDELPAASGRLWLEPYPDRLLRDKQDFSPLDFSQRFSAVQRRWQHHPWVVGEREGRDQLGARLRAHLHGAQLSVDGASGPHSPVLVEVGRVRRLATTEMEQLRKPHGKEATPWHW